MHNLEEYGAGERFFAEATLYPGLIMGRVISQYNELYKIITQDGELLAEVSGKFRYNARYLSDYPAVGDFVMLDRSSDEAGNAIIHQVLSRKSSFERAAVGYKNQTQVIAANIDIVFICMSLNNDFNLRRLERYLAIAWDSRAKPVLVLTKSDLCNDIQIKLNDLARVAIGVDIIVTSSFELDSCHELLSYLKPGITASFIGSSGVGKSTLINALIGQEVLATSAIRNDDKGRHTTTRRELMLLPQGGIVIDTPGMREIGLDSVDLSKSFIDIDGLSSYCRFKDCTHTNEPGCAVIAAINNGDLDTERLDSYRKLKKEALYDGMNSRQIEQEKINNMFAGFEGIKNAKKYVKEKYKRK